MNQKIRKPRKQAKPKPKPVLVTVFNNARFPVQYDAAGFKVPPKTSETLILNEYVQSAIDKGLFTVTS